MEIKEEELYLYIRKFTGRFIKSNVYKKCMEDPTTRNGWYRCFHRLLNLAAGIRYELALKRVRKFMVRSWRTIEVWRVKVLCVHEELEKFKRKRTLEQEAIKAAKALKKKYSKR